jgi:DNA-binding NarL/FixJ family response regulator
LVDHFDSDGKRFVIAIKNSPALLDPRGLTPGERQIAEYFGLGYPTKEIAHVFGISDSAVTNSIVRIQKKLCLSSRTEVAFFFAKHGLRQKLMEVAIRGEQLLVSACPLIEAGSVLYLTGAELEVATQIISGYTNSDIARRRSVSEHTVANQVCSLFAKLHIHSRAELAARLHTRNPEHTTER